MRVLARRDAAWEGAAPEVVRGDLQDGRALDDLCRGADAVVHAAGLIRARHDRDFTAVNVDGAARTARAARRTAPDAAFVLVSSLAARSPELSAYTRSKREGETAVQDAYDGAAQVARPCAVYGPGDRATLPLFRAAALLPVLPIPGAPGRLTLVHAEDCAEAIVAMASAPRRGRTATLTDARPEGYGWPEIGRTLAQAAGRKPRLLPVAPFALRAAGTAGDLARRLGRPALTTSDKIREVLHEDWSVTPDERLAEFVPAWNLERGFTATFRAYRAAAWIR